ncbi:HD domain-containing protein [Fulvivirga sp. M361]|nr:HD domain-containing protein [Fulvivirga sp. M361]
MEELNLVNESQKYAESILQSLSPGFHYHNLAHTREVVEAVQEIGTRSELSPYDLETVILAAWYHDLGYSLGEENHEDESIRLMKEKLLELGEKQERIDQISKIIKSTQMPQNPKDELSKVMCDADLYHLSTDLFSNRSEYLRKELGEVCQKSFSEKEWKKVTVEFMNAHSYFTNYAKLILEPRKKKNLKKLKKEKATDSKYIEKLENQVVKLQNKVEQTKIQKPDRGIETMFRITSKNHLTLSGMADNKANIMISINSIILSVLVSVLFRKLEDYPHLIVPGLILVFVCLTTIVFAILATRPNVSSGTFTKEDIVNKKTNLLFFGNFHNSQLDDYMWGMKEMMRDADYLYGSMIKDIYFLGLVLGKKYKMLRKSYTIFMYGFIFSIVSFLIAMLFFKPGV